MYNFEKFWKEILFALVTARWTKCEPAIQVLHQELLLPLAIAKIHGSATPEITAKMQEIAEKMQAVCHQHDLGLWLGINWDSDPSVDYIRFPISSIRQADTMLADMDTSAMFPN